MRSNQRWLSASTMTSWYHFYLTITKNCQNLTQLQQCYGVRVHSYACVTNWKVKEHFIYVQNGCGNQSKVLISLTMTSWHHFHSTVTQNCQNLAQLQQCYGVRVHLYACVPNWKVKKHFINVQNEGGKQSKMVISLNMTSWHHFHSSVPRIAKIWPSFSCVVTV